MDQRYLEIKVKNLKMELDDLLCFNEAGDYHKCQERISEIIGELQKLSKKLQDEV